MGFRSAIHCASLQRPSLPWGTLLLSQLSAPLKDRGQLSDLEQQQDDLGSLF